MKVFFFFVSTSLLCCLARGDEPLPGEKESSGWQRLFRDQAAAYHIDVDKSGEAQMVSEPVLRWTHPARGGEHGAVLALIRYSCTAGSRDFEFFGSFQTFSERLRQLPYSTCVTVFRQPQLPMRGVVDDAFIVRCLESIPDGSEYLVAETVWRAAGRVSWLHHGAGESHADLQNDLENCRGAPVAVGLYPPWLHDTEDVISAVVPDENDLATTGIY